jgi:nicotinamide mononucleotide adenylyltransferase
MNNIIIIPGSYKPPHKGHLSLLIRLIKKSNISKIIIIISKKVRSLDKRFLYMEQIPKIELQNALIEYFPLEKEEIILMTKEKIIKRINEYMKDGLLKSINSIQSYKIWNIYLKYLKNKYKKIPNIVFRISENNNIMLEADKVILESFKEKPTSITLMKSAKNEHNTRFDFLERKYKNYIKTALFPNIKDIDATGMRQSILENNKISFLKYLPKDLDEKDKNKIWSIAKK